MNDLSYGATILSVNSHMSPAQMGTYTTLTTPGAVPSMPAVNGSHIPALPQQQYGAPGATFSQGPTPAMKMYHTPPSQQPLL